jgi:hypothetical protein
LSATIAAISELISSVAIATIVTRSPGDANEYQAMRKQPKNSSDLSGLEASSWTQEEVIDILTRSKFGLETLRNVDKVPTWRVTFIHRWGQTKTKGEQWIDNESPEDKTGWSKENLIGLKKTYDDRVHVFLLENSSPLEVAMTLVHEVAHVMQGEQEKQGRKYRPYEKETEAFARETMFVLEIERLPEAPERYRRFAKDGKVDLDAIQRYLKESYSEEEQDGLSETEQTYRVKQYGCEVVLEEFGRMSPTEYEYEYGSLQRVVDWNVK